MYVPRPITTGLLAINIYSDCALVVVVDDVLTQLIWTRYFLKEQGHMIQYNVIYQYNQSAIRLENNGRQSISKRTKHINIRYNFITDRIIKQEAFM